MMTKRLIRLVVLALVVAGSLLTETSSAGAQSYSWVYLRRIYRPYEWRFRRKFE